MWHNNFFTTENLKKINAKKLDMFKKIKGLFGNFFKIFKKKKMVRLGLYGPPNAGKCVTPETEVVLQNGQVKPIKEIFDEIKNNKEIQDEEYKEIYIDVSDSNIIIPSFDIHSLKIIPKKVSHIYSQKYKGKILSIKTRSGRSIRATPNHPLVRISNNGAEYIRSGNLNVGECVGITKKLLLTTSLEVPQISNEIFATNNGQIQTISQLHNPKSITAPEYIDEELVSFVAYIIAESYHGQNKIIFSNTDPILLTHFDNITNKLFNLNPIHRMNKGVSQIEIYSKTLCDWLSNTIGLNHSVSKHKQVPPQLMGLPDNLTAILLRRLFDCEGYVPKTVRERGAEIEFSSKSKRLVEQVQLLLNRFEIVGKFREKTVNNENYYKLLIGGSDNHRLFRDKIGFDIKRKAENLDVLCAAGLKRNRFSLPIMKLLETIQKKMNLSQEQFFLDNKHIARMRRDNRIIYHRVSSMAKKTNHEFLNKVSNADTLWDEILEIKEEEYDGYVYDMTVEDTHTFIVSNGLIAHNTSLANKICQDWLGEDMGTASEVPHETREISMKEHVEIKSDGKTLSFNLIDTPGISTKIDYEDFMKFKMKKKDAQERAKEATKGVIEAIKWLENVDVVITVLDATINPYSQVNITIIGNLAARDIPVLIVGNKVDLKNANIKRIESAFPQYPVVGISAATGENIEEFYEQLFSLVK